jgi:hypothetical protein
MSIATVIIGESGTGKTASLRNLDPSQVLLIQAQRKPLPFRNNGWAPYNRETKEGNVIVTDKSSTIESALRTFKQPIIIIDDWQYILANEFMSRSDEKGFEKFTEIGRHAWDVMRAATSGPVGRRVYVLAHSQSDEFGRTKIKTIGKLLDEKITVEGMFSIVLKTVVSNGDYKFSTQNSGFDTCKSPIGLFKDQLIDNDLEAVDSAICAYYCVEKKAVAETA